jgi:vacuolar-type H+-ATPase subunit E/Vma4
VLEEVRARAREAAVRLREDPRYPELLERLKRIAIAQLGNEAELEVDPSGVGGVIAHAGSVRVDYTLPALAERALEALDGELERLWS